MHIRRENHYIEVKNKENAEEFLTLETGLFEVMAEEAEHWYTVTL